jgi:hypothetical protein
LLRVALQLLKSVSQLITQRQQVSLLIRHALIDRARDFRLILDDVSITELSFSQVYAQAVESKQASPFPLRKHQETEALSSQTPPAPRK